MPNTRKNEWPKGFTYEDAWAELQQIEAELSDQKVPIEKLSGKVARAKALLDFCRDKLRQVEGEVNSLLDKDDGKSL